MAGVLFIIVLTILSSLTSPSRGTDQEDSGSPPSTSQTLTDNADILQLLNELKSDVAGINSRLIRLEDKVDKGDMLQNITRLLGRGRDAFNGLSERVNKVINGYFVPAHWLPSSTTPQPTTPAPPPTTTAPPVYKGRFYFHDQSGNTLAHR